MLKNAVIFTCCGLSLPGCAAKPPLPGSGAIVVSLEPAPAGCEWLGEVEGSQGNFWTAEFTSDANLINGARNDMRNAAWELGADYVKIESESYSENTSAGSLGGTYSAVVIGNAYRCDGGMTYLR